MHRPLDDTDRRIIECLRQNARISMKELGQAVFLTGQAARNRVDRLEDLGILKRYTVRIDCPVFGYKVHALIRLSPRGHNSDALHALFCGPDRHVLHSYQTTGERNLLFDMVFKDMETLDALLKQIEPLGPYDVDLVLKERHELEA